MVFGVLSVMSYVHISLLTRSHSEVEFAKWAFFLTGFTLLGGIRSGLVLPWLVKYTQKGNESGNTESRNAIIASVWVVTLGVSICLVLVFFAASWQGHIAYYLIKWMPICFIAGLPNLIATWQLIVARDFARMFVIRFGFLGSFSVYCLWNYYDRGSMEMTVVAFIASQSLASLIAILWGFPCFPTKWPSRKYRRQILAYSPSTVISNMMGTSQHFLELSLVAIFFSPLTVALYAVPLRVLNGYDIILRALMSNFFPQAGKLANEQKGQPFRLLVKKYTLMTSGVFAIFSMLVILLSHEVLQVLGGDKYQAASALLIVMAASVILRPLERVFGSGLEVTGRPQWNSYMIAGALVTHSIAITVVAWMTGDVLYVAMSVAVARVLHVVAGAWLLRLSSQQYFHQGNP